MTPAVQTLNALVAEFDEVTRFKFDQIFQPLFLAHLARVWPAARRSLGDDLEAAFVAVEREKGGGK